jgi:hypothetical protein
MKNWPNESNTNCKPILDLKKYFKKKEFFGKGGLQEQFFFEKLQVDNY